MIEQTTKKRFDFFGQELIEIDDYDVKERIINDLSKPQSFQNAVGLGGNTLFAKRYVTFIKGTEVSIGQYLDGSYFIRTENKHPNIQICDDRIDAMINEIESK